MTNIPARSRRLWKGWLLLAGELVGCAAAFVVSGFFAFVDGRLAIELRVALVLVALLAALFFSRRAWAALFGPVFFYDMMRTARRGRIFDHRVLYVSTLLFLLVLMLIVHARLSIYDVLNLRFLYDAVAISVRDMPQFADAFFTVFLIAQFAAIFLMTPVYTAGAIAEEKERRTLEYLMATEITDREIVLHKLFSRLCNLLALVLAGLPVLMAVQFLGGIDPNLVLAGFAASAVTVLSLGSLSILLSVLARRPLEAIFGTYFWIAAAFLFFSCCPPGWFANPVFVFRKINARFGRSASLAEEFDLSMIADVLIAYGSLHLTFALFCVGLAILTVREAALREFGSAECADDTPPRFTQRDLNRLGLAASKLAESVILEQARPSQPSTDAVVAAMLRRRPMPIGDQPLLWRESRPFALDYLARHHPFFAFLTFLALGVILAASVVTLVITMTLDSSITEKSITLRTQTASAVALSVGCLLTGLSASTRITSERERRTLDMLLTAPVEHDEILLAKWLGSFLATKVAWLTLAVVWALGILAGGMQWLALPFTLTASAVHASFAAMFGLWCSARSPTTQRAVTITAASLIVIGVAPVGAAAVVSRLPDVPNPNKRWLVPLVVNLSPPMNLMQLTFVAPGRARNDEAIPSNMWDSPSLELSGTAWLPYVVATLLMWRSVRRRFRSELDQTTPSAAKLNTGEPERETWLRER